MLSAVIVIVVSYLIGGVPVAYLTGRMFGVDIREAGTGNVGPSNLWQVASKVTVVPVGLTEIMQGMAGIIIAKLAGESLAVQVTAGLAAIAAHNWSPFIGFTGGRGIAHAIGFMLMLSWPALAAFCLLALAGVALRSVPQYVGLGVAMAPVAALGWTQSPEIVAGMAAMAALIFAKRLLTNRPGLPQGADGGEVLLNRLRYDRDTRERESWVRGRHS